MSPVVAESDNRTSSPPRFRTAAVVGAGVMGAGIAQTLAIRGIRVTCVDLDEVRLGRARQTVEDGRFGLRNASDRGLLDEPWQDVAARLTYSVDLAGSVGDVDLVMEAIPEELGSKVKLFRDLDRLSRPETVLVSNTSGFPISALAQATDRPALVAGWHWASPPPVNKLAEIVMHAESDRDVVESLVALASACGKNPVVLPDQPRVWGFVANRVYFAMIAEAQRVVQEGVVTAEQLDQIMVDCFRWPVGPLSMVESAHAGWEKR
ncbi:3-hydroxyacyl-CoA dehydrogenase family protein [Streptomyces sp. NPDC008343]|uniref:3-hydroxyacyl-CoA dehydrogenase family protein n=1 Tax=Streptomyces sp. NPDC008343 TaxID=3364828 RepID=UPI0036EB77EA